MERYEGGDVNPWLSWENDDGNAVFNGDVTILLAEAGELFLRLPAEGLCLDFSGGLPTLRLGSLLFLGAARFLAGAEAAGCLGVSLKVLVLVGAATSMSLVTSLTRILVEGCGIAFNWLETDIGNISGLRTVGCVDIGVVSFATMLLELQVCTGATGRGTNPGRGDCRRLSFATLVVFCPSDVTTLKSNISVGVFAEDGFLPLCFGVEGGFCKFGAVPSDFGDCSEETEEAPVESLGLGIFLSLSFSGLSFGFSLSFSIFSFSFTSLSFSFSTTFIDLSNLSNGLLLKRTPLACTEWNKNHHVKTN